MKRLVSKPDFQIIMTSRSTGITNNINNGSVLFNFLDKPWQSANKTNPKTLKMKQQNGIVPVFLTTYTCAFVIVTFESAIKKD